MLKLMRDMGSTNGPAMENDPFKQDVVLDLQFNQNGMVNFGNYDDSPEFPRGVAFSETEFQDIYAFDVVSDKARFIQYPYSDLFNPQKTKTTEAWFIRDSDNHGVVYSIDTYGSTYDDGLVLYNDGVIRSYTYGTSANISGSIGRERSIENIGKLIHVAKVFDQGTNKTTIFYNGGKIVEANLHHSNWGSKLTIGCASWNNPNTFLDGRILRFRITKAIRYDEDFDVIYPKQWARS